MRVPETDAHPPGDQSADLGVLKKVAVIAPVTFVAAVELLRYFIVEERYDEYSGAHAIAHVVLAIFTVAAAITFALVMFRAIEKAQRGAVQHQRELATLSERHLIARELHDVDAQVLAAIHLRLRGLASSMAPGSALHTEVSSIADICQDGYRDVRETLLGLHESAGGERGFVAGLRTYIEKHNRQSGVHAVLETSLDESLDIPAGVSIQLIRVIQEALANVRKHARTPAATVHVEDGGGGITVVVSDHGCGFDAASLEGRGDRYGLSTMRERMTMIGGTLTIETAPRHGTRVTATVPARALARTASSQREPQHA